MGEIDRFPFLILVGGYALTLVIALMKLLGLLHGTIMWTQQKSFFSLMLLASALRCVEFCLSAFAQPTVFVRVLHFFMNTTGFATFVIDKLFIVFFFVRSFLAARGYASLGEIMRLNRIITRLHIAIAVILYGIVWVCTGIEASAIQTNNGLEGRHMTEVSLDTLSSVCVLIGIGFAVSGMSALKSVSKFASGSGSKARSRQIKISILAIFFVFTFFARAALLFSIEYDDVVNQFYFNAAHSLPNIVALSVLEIVPSIMAVFLLRTDMRELSQPPTALITVYNQPDRNVFVLKSSSEPEDEG